jgi:hypothetical protein
MLSIKRVISYGEVVLLIVLLALSTPGECKSPLDAVQVLQSQKILAYYPNYLSPDQRKIVLESWDFDKQDRTLVQNIEILNLANGTILGQLSPSRLSEHRTYIEANSVCWDKKAHGILFALSPDYRTIYKWDLVTNGIAKLITAPHNISHMAISKTGELISYIEYLSERDCRLKVNSLDFDKEIEIAKNVDNVTPVWKGDHALVFSKNNAVFEYDMTNHTTQELVRSGDLEISQFEMLSEDKLFIVMNTVHTPRNGRIVTSNDILGRKTGKRVMQYDFITRFTKNIMFFDDVKPGIAITECCVVVPFVIDDSSLLLAYNFATGTLRKLVPTAGDDDLPMSVLGNEAIIFRRNAKQIYLLRTKTTTAP